MTFATSQLLLATLSMCLSIVGLAGCNPPAEQSGEGSGQENHAEDHDHGDGHGDHDHGADASSEEVEEALAALSPEDRAAAKSQRICPVTEELLGSMGTPIKITVEGQEVFICCQGCEDMLRENPDEYLPKLNQ